MIFKTIEERLVNFTDHQNPSTLKGHLLETQIPETFQPSLSIIIPTYNEADNIAELINRIEQSLKGYNFEVIIVDDNSQDGTAGIVNELCKTYKNVKLFKRLEKRGLASAVVYGVNKTNAEVIVILDADLQHPPEIIPALFEKLKKDDYDIVIASRYICGSRIKEWSLWRKFISLCAIFLAKFLLPETRGIGDVTSGYFIFKRDVIKGVSFNAKSFKLLLEILVKANYKSVTEIPYTFTCRKKGRSKLNLFEVLEYLILLLRLKMESAHRVVIAHDERSKR